LGAVLALTAGLAFAALFFAAVIGLRAGALAAVARFAWGLVEDFAFTARFAEGFALERDVDRLNPFVRLLLMCGISKGCSPVASSRRNRPGAYHRSPPKSTSIRICGCFKVVQNHPVPTHVPTKKNT
jgi:hypothetical protein